MWCLKIDYNKKIQAFFEEKLSETIDKPKELWKSLKSLLMLNNTVIFNLNAIEEGNTWTHDSWNFQKFWKTSFQT